jgi:hypothetical protein
MVNVFVAFLATGGFAPFESVLACLVRGSWKSKVKSIERETLFLNIFIVALGLPDQFLINIGEPLKSIIADLALQRKSKLSSG